MRRLAVGLLALIAAACSGSESADESAADIEVPEGCNPIAFEHDCLLPYPSDVFLADDATLPSGKRVALSDAASLRRMDGSVIDLLSLHPADGFSHGSQILALFPEGVRDDELVFHSDDVSQSLTAESPTLLIDADAGRPLLHFAEVDPRPDDTQADRRALFLRPMVRLANQTRYVVALHGLKNPAGDPLQAPTGFAAIRDGKAAGHPVLGPLAEHYEADVFPLIEAQGVSRSELLLAWDFTTESQANVTGDMLTVRDDLMQRLETTPPAISVVSVTDDVDTHTYRQIEATLRVPLYVESAEPGAALVRDASGNVTANGEVDVPFTVLIPQSVWNRAPTDPPARLLQFGHGFFGDRSEIEDYVAQFADERGFVVVAADWWGMSGPDKTVVSDAMVADTDNTMRFTDRVHQGMANFIALAHAAQGPLAQMAELEVRRAPAYDASHLYFYGISQGHILGGTYAALSPAAERVTLSVGGANFSLMMFRARPFIPFLFLIQAVLPDPLDQQKMAMMLQTSFDRIDPLTYAPHVLGHVYPGAPADRRLLMQIGVNDSAVNNLAAHLHARALGLSHLTPAPRQIAGLDAVIGPFDGSAIVEFDFGAEPNPLASPPSRDNPVHEAVRRLTAAKEQIDRFFQPGGAIEPTCDGPCDPE